MKAVRPSDRRRGSAPFAHPLSSRTRAGQAPAAARTAAPRTHAECGRTTCVVLARPPSGHVGALKTFWIFLLCCLCFLLLTGLLPGLEPSVWLVSWTKKPPHPTLPSSGEACAGVLHTQRRSVTAQHGLNRRLSCQKQVLAGSHIGACSAWTKGHRHRKRTCLSSCG